MVINDSVYEHKEFIDLAFLQKGNRQFLYSCGLVLVVKAKDTGEYRKVANETGTGFIIVLGLEASTTDISSTADMLGITAVRAVNKHLKEGMNMLKFKGQDGKIKAVLKDDMSEPEGFEFKDEPIDAEDLPLGEGAKSLEELEEEEDA